MTTTQTTSYVASSLWRVRRDAGRTEIVRPEARRLIVEVPGAISGTPTVLSTPKMVEAEIARLSTPYPYR